MEPIIEIKNISKKYRIGIRNLRYIAMRDILGSILKNPFKYFRSRVGGPSKKEFWALTDVNLSVEKGEAIGIIGPNGAGKSTLLKILAQITPPTTGEIKIHGRVVSLLEVGTGFHPELTGRENIFLNGAIMGMPRKEIANKMEEIIDFAGVREFIDTPVKRYSSGMYVRLAFSIAAHVEPDILIVDEVLAVGDAEFQKKCLGKMEEVSGTTGRTILFVSHNMDAIARLCKKTVLLDKGKIVMVGSTPDVISRYLKVKTESDGSLNLPIVDHEVTLERFTVTQNQKPAAAIDGDTPFEIDLEFRTSQSLQSFRVGVFLKNVFGIILARSFIQDYDPTLESVEPGHYKTSLQVPPLLFLGGEYELELKIFCQGRKQYFTDRTLSKQLTIQGPKHYNEWKSKNPSNRGYFLVPSLWRTEKI